jgi:protein MpaA
MSFKLQTFDFAIDIILHMKNLFLLTLLMASLSCSHEKPVPPTSSEVTKVPVSDQSSTATSDTDIQKQAPTVKPVKKAQIKKVIKNTKAVSKYCKKIDKYFRKYKWGKSQCEKHQWNHVRSSHWGTPIVWKVFGNEEEIQLSKKNVTLILCGVHGDEITPVKFCFDILDDLHKNPKLVGDNLVVIAPVVSPDSFFKKYPTRTNGRGIDVNRNFPTRDWKKNAVKLWKSRYNKDKRRYPGKKALSEQETIFQVNLIKRYKPTKILSVHAPLTLIDYDGPELKDSHSQGAAQLLIQMSDKAGKYRINNYPFFTGSLGNWAGNERNIPTYTLELPNSDWNKTKRYYKTFRDAIHHAIDHDLNYKTHTKKSKNISEKTGKEKSVKNETVL